MLFTKLVIYTLTLEITNATCSLRNYTNSLKHSGMFVEKMLCDVAMFLTSSVLQSTCNVLIHINLTLPVLN